MRRREEAESELEGRGGERGGGKRRRAGLREEAERARRREEAEGRGGATRRGKEAGGIGGAKKRGQEAVARAVTKSSAATPRTSASFWSMTMCTSQWHAPFFQAWRLPLSPGYLAWEHFPQG